VIRVVFPKIAGRSISVPHLVSGVPTHQTGFASNRNGRGLGFIGIFNMGVEFPKCGLTTS